MTTWTPEKLAEARALCEAATPGEWKWEDWQTPFSEGGTEGPNKFTLTAPPGTHDRGPSEMFPDMRNDLLYDEEHKISENDRAFIAAARTMLPAALDEIERLRNPATRASTHSEGCWRWRHHHECAIDRVEMLEAENARLRRALDASLVSPRHALLERAGKGLTISQVGERLNLPADEVDELRNTGRILAVHNLDGRGWVYPACQFDGSQIVPGLADVLSNFTIKNAWTRLYVLIGEDQALGGRTPIEALKDGDLDTVCQIVRDYGQQGGSEGLGIVLGSESSSAPGARS